VKCRKNLITFRVYYNTELYQVTLIGSVQFLRGNTDITHRHTDATKSNIESLKHNSSAGSKVKAALV